MKKLLPFLCLGLFATTISAQTTLRGIVRSAFNGEVIVGASISVKAKPGGATTDAQGQFSLSTDAATPFNIVVYSVGLARQEFTVTDVTPGNLFGPSDLDVESVELIPVMT